MAKRNMWTLGLVCLLNVGFSFAMEVPSCEKKNCTSLINADSRNEGQVAMLECPEDFKSIQWDDFLEAFSAAKCFSYIKNKEDKNKNLFGDIEYFYQFELNGYIV